MPGSPLNPAVESVSAFFPCHNDETTITSMVNAVVETIENIGADGEVIVVNEGSTDGSQEVLEDLADLQPMLRIVVHDRTRGYGVALRSGFAAATNQWVFYTDGDGGFDPTELRTLVEAASPGVDVVQGYRIRRAQSLVRRIAGRAYHRLVAMVFGLKIRDVDCDFRLIRRSWLDQVDLRCSSGVLRVELVRKLQDAGARFVEVPVHHYFLQDGRSRFLRPGAGLGAVWDLVRLWTRLVVLRRGARARRQAERAA